MPFQPISVMIPPAKVGDKYRDPQQCIAREMETFRMDSSMWYISVKLFPSELRSPHGSLMAGGVREDLGL